MSCYPVKTSIKAFIQTHKPRSKDTAQPLPPYPSRRRGGGYRRFRARSPPRLPGPMPSVQGLAVRRPALRIAGRRLVVGEADARRPAAMVRALARPRARIQGGNLAGAGDLGPDDGLQGHLVLLAHDVEVGPRSR